MLNLIPRLLATRYLKILMLAVGIMLIAGCSANRLAYKNLDWLIPWKVGDYVSLDRDQKRWFSDRLDQHLQWHCSTEMPQYELLLNDLQSTLLINELDPALLLDGLPKIESAADRMLLELTPTLVALLRQLDDSQIAELTANMAEKHLELEEEYIEPDLPTQHQERIERTQERFVDWMGPITNQQAARLSDWSTELKGHNRIWLDNRQVWQREFIQTLKVRESVEFEERIKDLLLSRERYWTPEFERIADINRTAGAQLVADMMALATDKQKEHLAKRLNRLRGDVQALQCASA